MKYGPDIPTNNYNGEYKVQKCPKCLNEDIEADADYCIMCGTSLTNICDGIESDYNGELIQHSNPANARFCHCCGKPTAYSRLAILPPYREALRRVAETEELGRELREMDIDEDLFWEMQGEEKPTGVGGNHSDASNSAATPGNQIASFTQAVDQDDDGELPF